MILFFFSFVCVCVCVCVCVWVCARALPQGQVSVAALLFCVFYGDCAALQ